MFGKRETRSKRRRAEIQMKIDIKKSNLIDYRAGTFASLRWACLVLIVLLSSEVNWSFLNSR